MLAADVGLESPTYMKMPAPNSTIEPTLAAVGDGGPGEELSAGTGDGVDSGIREEIDRQKTGEWVCTGPVRIVALRTKTLRELNLEPETCHHVRSDQGEIAFETFPRVANQCQLVPLVL
jgi:hypothetical protein